MNFLVGVPTHLNPSPGIFWGRVKMPTPIYGGIGLSYHSLQMLYCPYSAQMHADQNKVFIKKIYY